MEDKLDEIFEYQRYLKSVEDRKTSCNINPPLILKSSNTVNTGPKGVLTDYQESKMKFKKDLQSQNQEKLDLIQKAVSATKTVNKDEFNSKNIIDDIDFLLDDPEFISKYNQSRFSMMQISDERMKQNNSGNYFDSQKSKTFGEYFEVEGNDLVEFIDNEPDDVLILLHIYNPDFRPCNRLNVILSKLSKRFKDIKMGCMIGDENSSFTIDNLPILVFYKAGKVLDSYINLKEILDYNFDEDDILEFLEKHGYIRRGQFTESDED